MENNFLLPVIGFEDNVMVNAQGSYVYDKEGNKYLDLNSGQFCTVLGHCNEKIIEDIVASMNHISHTSSNIVTDEVLLFSQNMYRLSGDMKAYSISLSTGAEAVEFCIRYAKAIKKKNGLICFDKGYHGLTLGAQSITYAGVYTKPHVSDIYNVPIPDTFANAKEIDACIDIFRNTIKENGEKIAAVVMEPIVSVGGMILPGKRYFKAISEICKEYGVLLIFDECQTGFARTGRWFMYQNLELVPDMVALAKGVGLGFPVSVAMFSEKIVKQYDFSMTHYSSHQNDAFAASIINAGVRYIENNNILPSVEKKGIYFLDKLKEVAKKTNHLVKPRGFGLMLGIDLYFENVENYREIYKRLYHSMMNRGIIIQGTNGGRTIRFLPDYLICENDIDKAINVLYEEIEKLA